MQTEKYRKYIIIALLIAVLFLFVEVMLFWNAYAGNPSPSSPGIFPFIFAILIVLCLGYVLNLSLQATNKDLIGDYINNQVSLERARLIKEFEQKEEKEQVTDQKEIIESKVNEIIPRGNYKNLDSLLEKYLKNLAKEINIVQGILYLKQEKTDEFKFSSGYALTNDKKIPGFKAGESLPGQVVVSSQVSLITDIPEAYFPVESGLGKSIPKQILFAPVKNNTTVIAVLELSFFKPLEGLNLEILQQSLNDISLKVEQTIKS
jgi:hypothetical protein